MLDLTYSEANEFIRLYDAFHRVEELLDGEELSDDRVEYLNDELRSRRRLLMRFTSDLIMKQLLEEAKRTLETK
jgi:hypothetical protein